MWRLRWQITRSKIALLVLRRARSLRTRHQNNEIRYFSLDMNSSYHTMEYDPFIKRHHALRNQLVGLMWGKSGHLIPQNVGSTRPAYSTVWNPNPNPTPEIAIGGLKQMWLRVRLPHEARNHQPSERDQIVSLRSLIYFGAGRNPATCGTNQDNRERRPDPPPAPEDVLDDKDAKVID